MRSIETRALFDESYEACEKYYPRNKELEGLIFRLTRLSLEIIIPHRFNVSLIHQQVSSDE